MKLNLSIILLGILGMSAGFSQNLNAQDQIACQVTIENQTFVTNSKDWTRILSNLSKTNGCVYGKIHGQPKTGVLFVNGQLFRSNLSNSEGDTQMESVERLQELTCKKVSCKPLDHSSYEPEESGLARNDSVIDHRTQHLGTVVDYFADGRTSILFEADTSRHYIRHYPNEISKEVNCFKNFCAGKSVIDYSNETGVIAKIFSNGMAAVLFPSDTSRYYFRIAGKEISLVEGAQVNGIRVGSRVIDNSDNSIGTVKFILPGGVFRILYDIDPSRYYDRRRHEIEPAY